MRLARTTTPYGRTAIAPDLAEVSATDLDATAYFELASWGHFRCIIQTRVPYARATATASTAIEAYRTALRNLLDDVAA